MQICRRAIRFSAYGRRHARLIATCAAFTALDGVRRRRRHAVLTPERQQRRRGRSDVAPSLQDMGGRTWMAWTCSATSPSVLTATLRAERRNSEMIVLGADLAVVRRWGEEGDGPGQFGFLRNEDPIVRSVASTSATTARSTWSRPATTGPTFQRGGESELTWGSLAVATASPWTRSAWLSRRRTKSTSSMTSGTTSRSSRRMASTFGPFGRKGFGDGELQFTGNIRFAPDGTRRRRLRQRPGPGMGCRGRSSSGASDRRDRSGEFNEPQDVAIGAGGTRSWWMTAGPGLRQREGAHRDLA